MPVRGEDHGLAEPVCRRPASAIAASARLGSLVASSPGPVLPTMCSVSPGEARKCAVYTNELFRFNYWSNEPPCLRFTACHLWCQCFLCSKYDRTVPSSKLYTLYEHGVLRKMLCVVYYKRLSDVPHIAGCADHVSNQELTTGTRVTGHWYVRSSHTNCKVRYMYRKCPP